jgi:hypothetical protein
MDRIGPTQRSSSILCILFIHVNFLGCGSAGRCYRRRLAPSSRERPLPRRPVTIQNGENKRLGNPSDRVFTSPD